VLQCVAVCCSVLQCVAVSCSALPWVAVRCSVLQCAAVCCSVLWSVALCCVAMRLGEACASHLHFDSIPSQQLLHFLPLLWATLYQMLARCAYSFACAFLETHMQMNTRIPRMRLTYCRISSVFFFFGWWMTEWEEQWHVQIVYTRNAYANGHTHRAHASDIL